MGKPFRIQRWSGLNNVQRPERAKPGHLQSALNVYVLNSGKLATREGHGAALYSGSPRSLHSDGRALYFRDGGDLKMLVPGDANATTLLSGFVESLPVAWLNLARKTYWSDGVRSGVIQDGRCRTWGLTPPPVPEVVGTVGDLIPGRYGVCLTYERNDGQESGSCPAVFCSAPSGGLRVSAIQHSLDPDVNRVLIYATTADGTVFHRAGAIQAGQGLESIVIAGGKIEAGRPLETELMVPPPAGSILEYYRGRIYIASGNTVFPSRPWRYELSSLDGPYFMFDREVTMVCAVETGIWMATEDEAIFVAGDDPGQEGGMRITTRIPFGTRKGSARKIDGKLFGRGDLALGDAATWVSRKGVVYLGADKGVYHDLTGSFFAAPAGEGAMVSFSRSEDDMDQYFFGVQVKNAITAAILTPIASIAGN